LAVDRRGRGIGVSRAVSVLRHHGAAATAQRTSFRLATSGAPRVDSQEYDNLERVEGAHWYYVAKRAFVRDWILRTQPPAPDDELLDCGAGTGRFALEMQAHCRPRVLDDHQEALARLRQPFPADR